LLKANKLYLIGIGYRPLGERGRELVLAADVILVSSRLHDVFTRYDEFEAVRTRIKVVNKVPDTIGFIREWFAQSAIRNPQSALPSLVLLASGDPFFFGIGRRMVEEFGKERIEIIPDLSSMQEAFARINEPWDDAFLISLHGGPDIAKRRKLPYEVKDLPWLCEKHAKIGVLTDRTNNPAVIAQVLQSAIFNPQSSLVIHVCEHLGYPDERIWTGSVSEAAGMTFADPNVVIIKRSGVSSQESDVRFGLREEDIEHERGLITKDEVRAVTIHKLRLPQSGVFWDIGAGSGSISLEAARLCTGLRIFAVEKEQERVDTIKKNIHRYNARKVEIIHGSAPDALADLPAPDRVFIGGSGGNLGDIVKLVNEKMSAGIMVVNAVTLETLNDSLTSLERNGFSVEVSEVSVSRSKIVGGKRLMNALNPVFIVTGEKGRNDG
jgi:precorrin-6Y C5,15-methyltransferase (decarboxylating)